MPEIPNARKELCYFEMVRIAESNGFWFRCNCNGTWLSPRQMKERISEYAGVWSPREFEMLPPIQYREEIIEEIGELMAKLEDLKQELKYKPKGAKDG